MIKVQTISDILSLYKKHGWILRRVLLSDALKKSLIQPPETIFGTVEIISSKLDGAWFSRVSEHGEAWELRRLSDAPFAFVEVFEIGVDQSVFEETLRETEQRMISKTG